MAMHIVRRPKTKQKALAQALPYKSTPLSLPVAEDTEKAEMVFGGGNYGGRYNMILVAAARAYDLLRGAPSSLEQGTHKPTVLAALEIEAGLIGQRYQPKYVKTRSK